MKHILKYILMFGLGILLARFIFFRNGVKTVSVKKVAITPREVKKTISASGEVKSKNKASLSFGAAGRIKEIEVKKGDHVKKDERLAYLNNASNYQTIQYYKDARDVALRDRDLFIENYATNLQAAGGKDEYNIQLRRLDELLSKAEAAYQAQLLDVSDTYIHAPFNGTVIDVEKEEGENIAATTTIVEIADLNNLIFEITLDQEDYGQIKRGQDVEIELDAYENHVFKGKVTNLPYFANGGDSPNFTVELSIEQNNSNKALLGMTGDAYIVVATTGKGTPSLIYDEILYDEENNPYVWVVKNNLLVKEYIEIGLEGDIYTEIKTPVTEDVVISVDSEEEIKEGYKAKIVQ